MTQDDMQIYIVHSKIDKKPAYPTGRDDH